MSETSASPMDVTYYCQFPSCSYVFKDGTTCFFIKHLYRTSNPTHIVELNHEAQSANNQYIRKATAEEAEGVLDATDYMGSLKEKLRREILREEKAKLLAANTRGDQGSYEPGNVMANAASTADLAPAVLVPSEQSEPTVTPSPSIAGLQKALAAKK